MTTNDQSNQSFGSPATLALCLFLAVAAFFLWTEHRAHLFGVLPYLILAACPVIHLFMHRGHRSHRRHVPDEDGTHRHGEAS